MTKKELDYILQNGESYYVEFKENVNKSLSREITAFANASGGKIYLGVSDNGELKGVKITNKLKSQIQDLANNCFPAVHITIEEYKEILIINVPEGLEKPYQCSDGFYIRMGANAQKMNRDKIIDFLQSEGHLKFEEKLHRKYDFKKDFSEEKLRAYLRLAGISTGLDNESILLNLGVAEKIGNELRMKNAGVLFFSESIELLCEQATITCGVFEGTQRVHVLNRKDYSMDIVSNIENALHFIKQELRVRYEMTGTAQRKEIYELPLDAIREAVINAVVHRDYFLTGSHVTVEIFDDRIEITNPGGLPKGLDQKSFGKRAVRRNQIIASLLHRINFVENMGTGINKIKNLMKAANKPDPDFEFDHFFTVVFFRKNGSEISSEKGSEISSEKGSEIILELMKENPKISARLLGEKIGITQRAVEKAIQKLKKEGDIKRVGSPKGGYWKVE